ncbi:MAG: PAS domain S-box protein [Pseudomonadota bacterium]
MTEINFYKQSKKTENNKETWKILIADDEIDIHLLTKTVLKNYTYKDKKLEFISTYSGEETIAAVKNNNDIVLILLDVIMEDDDTGLQVVKSIREDFNNHSIQIILRTGQAADIPENDLVMKYEINDYKEKTELTSKKLITTITTAIRAYENILALQNSKKEIGSLYYDLKQLMVSFDKSVIASKVDENGKLTYVSQSFCKTFEYSPEELLGQTHDFLRHKKQDKSTLADVMKSYAEKKAWEGELMYSTKSGHTFWAYVHRFPEYDSNNKFINFTNMFSNITHQKKAESLNYELKNLISTFDKHVIVSKTDRSGKILYISTAYYKATGYKKNELLDHSHSVLSHKDTTKEFYQDLWQTISSGKVWRGEIKDKKKNGDAFWLHTIITPEYDVKGDFLCYTAISQDITHQKYIEEANRKIEILNTEIEETQKEVVFRMGSIGESRSKETGMHVKRVADYSKILAHHLGMSEKESELLRLASPMHDIGKVAIPDAILNKPGKYTPEEFEIMKTHAQLGYEMLNTSKRSILKVAAIVAHEHQEKYDGTGYPLGLKGSKIHIYGRITAVADVFDALGSDRVYKKAWEDEKIFDFFKKERGKHFDPKLVDIFFNHMDEFLVVREKFKDEF